MMKRVCSIVFGVICLALPDAAYAEEVFIARRVNGRQEVPPNQNTSGSGFAVLVINGAQDEIGFFVSYEDLGTNSISSHFHTALPGVDGPIIFDLGPVPTDTAGFLFGTLTAANFMPGGGLTTWEDALIAIREGRFYVNVHSESLPGGEIRGQLLPL
jgi:hypothetical protein